MKLDPSPVDDDETAPVREGESLEWQKLERYLRENLPDLDGPFSVAQFPHGSANLTYLISIGSTRLVIRRPPFGTVAPGAHDMKREFTALSALAPLFDRVAVAHLYCSDHGIVGSDFLVLEYRSGVVVRHGVPESMAHFPDVSSRLGFAIVDALADLHSLDATGPDLKHLGRPPGFVERQIAGWSRRWELVDVGRVPTVSAVAERLARTVPDSDSRPAAVLHNDFKPDNCQFDPQQPDRVKSIFDWDMCTLGDPLVDLGTLLNYWPDPSDSDDNRPLHAAGLERMGLPSREEVVRYYRRQTGFEITDVGWFEAFAAWKTCVVLEQLHQRFVRGESTDPRMYELGAPVARLAERAMGILESVGC